MSTETYRIINTALNIGAIALGGLILGYLVYVVRRIRAEQQRLNSILDLELDHVLEKDVTKAYESLQLRYTELEQRYALLARASELDGARGRVTA